MRFLNTKDVGNCECDPDFFEKEKQKEENKKKKKRKSAEKGKRRGRIEAIGQNFPLRQFLAHTGRVVAFTMARTHTHTRAHTHRIGGPFPGNEKRSRSERRRSGKKRGGPESTKRRIEHRPNRVEIWSYGVMHVGIWRT